MLCVDVDADGTVDEIDLAAVEGMVHVSNLYDDRYYYNEETYEMYGVETGKVYQMGQRVKVRVLDADKEMRTIDFCIGE